MAGSRRVPYEWVLGAMFVGSFYIVPWVDSSFVARGVWLVVVGPLAGIALGAKAKPRGAPPRFGMLLFPAVLGWLYCASVFLLVEVKSKSVLWERRESLEGAIEWLLSLWPVPLAPNLLGLIVAALMPRRYREFAVFAIAAFLLVFALGWDIALTPRE